MRQLLPVQRDLSPDELFDLYDEPGPFLRAGFVTSVDGTIAVDGRSEGLSSPADKAVFGALRAVCDAVVVGAGTARDEGYGPARFNDAAAAWREAHGRSPGVPIVVVSRSGRIHPRLLEGPVIACVPAGAAVPEGVDVIRSTAPADVVAGLRERGLTRLLCEGGPSLLTAFLAADVVDELCLTTSPKAVGGGPYLLGTVPTKDLVLRSLVHDDPGVLLARWSVVRSGHD